MNDYRKQTEAAASKVIDNVDDRLRSFFDNSDIEVTGPIFQELNNISDRYLDPQEVACGGMKRILSVFDKSTDRNAAMAVLYDDAPEEQYEPFLREARLTARLDHPNIIKIHDIGLDKDQKPYFTMDLKSGSNLSIVLKEGSQSLRDLLIIFMKVCDAVAYAHSKGVLHLDLKPENIQIGDFGEVMVCDWGLGKVIDDNSFTDEPGSGSDLLNNMTLHGKIKGTPGFMAPEQVTGEDKGKFTDIYALGSILYNILTGERPLSGTVEDILKKTVHAKVIPPVQRCPDKNIPTSLEAVVLKAMQAEPENRYSKVTDLAADIRSYLSGFATAAENAGFIKQFSLMLKRNKGVFAVMVTAFLILVIASVLFVRRIQNERAVAIDERDRANTLSKSESQARALAEQSVKLLAKEKQQLKKLNERYIGELTLQSVFVTDNINHWDVYDEKIYNQTLFNLEKAIKMGSRSQAVAEKAVLLMIMQRYDEALKGLQKAADISFLKPVCRKGMEYTEDGKLSAEELSDLLAMINRLDQKRPYRKAMVDKMIAYDKNIHDRNLDERLLITSRLIKVWNTDWKGNMQFDRETRKLILEGKGISFLRTTKNTFTIKHNILRLIKPLSLQFIDTKFSDLTHLADLPLKELDIRGTKVKDLSKLEELKQLSYLVIRPNQFSEKKLKAVPSWIELRIK